VDREEVKKGRGEGSFHQRRLPFARKEESERKGGGEKEKKKSASRTGVLPLSAGRSSGKIGI